MAYKVRIAQRVLSQIQAWHLPDEILVELDLYLNEVLPADLEHNLIREESRLTNSVA